MNLFKKPYENLVEMTMPKPNNRFDYVAYDASAKSLQNDFKEAFTGLAQGIGILGNNRSTGLALTHLEECYMWVGKAIRDDQIARNEETELEEGRSNS